MTRYIKRNKNQRTLLNKKKPSYVMLYILNIGTEHTEFVVLAKVYKTAKELFLNDTITKKSFIKVLSIKKY